jgi:hypothetical protein
MEATCVKKGRQAPLGSRGIGTNLNDFNVSGRGMHRLLQALETDSGDEHGAPESDWL